MPLTIVPPKPGRTPNYHIRGTYLGVPVNRSAGTPDRRLATKLKKRIEQEIESGIRTPSCGPTFLAALDNGTLYLGKTKNGDPITIPLADHVVAKFKAMPPRPSRPRKIDGPLRNGVAGMSQAGAGVPFLKRNPDDRLFRFHQGGRLRKLLAQAMANAGLSFPKRERGFHLFCHTYGTWLMRGGMDNYALARVTGRWKDPRSAEPYLHNLVSSEARRVANSLPTPTRAKRVQA